ncbi:MAG: UDP-N-acetylmuramoyl-L-alanine--D-glutamate ligase [Thalassolituus sp.]
MTNAQNNKHYLIIGLGLTGLSCARFCQAKGLQYSLCDTRAELPGLESIKAEFSGIEVQLGLPSLEALSQYDELLVSPGIDTSSEYFNTAREQGILVSGDVQLFSEYCDKPVIAITGSNGKSTVTTLVAELLKGVGVNAVACGNIGVPVLDLLTAGQSVDVFVAELSSFQLETTRNLNAAVATILNISPDHMDRYGNMASYERAKQRIFQGAQAVVINADDDHTCPVLDVAAQVTAYSIQIEKTADFGIAEISGATCLMHGDQILLSADDLKIRGLHNVANSLAALALVDAAGYDISAEMISVLKNFGGLDHRCQWVAGIDGVDYFNDSKGTNIGSTVAAIKGLAPQTKGKLWLIAGGEGKGQDFAELAGSCAEVESVFLFGADAQNISGSISASVECVITETLDQALKMAAEKAGAGDVILFSPACASFDQFRNYVHRGEYFCQCVEELKS